MVAQTIPASQIVEVNPSVLSAGGDQLDIIGLFLTTSARVPIGTVSGFVDAPDVGSFFGLSSNEFNYASKYFAGFDNSPKKPGSMLFAQYNTTAVAAYLRGGNITGLTLLQLQALSGTLSIVMDGYTHNAGTVSLSAATSFSSAATIINSALTGSEPTEATCSLGTIAGTVMTVAGSITGVFAPGQTVTGSSVTANSIILAQLTGSTGAAGTYSLSQSSTVVSGEVLTASATAPVFTFDSVSGAFVCTSGITGIPSTAAFATGTLAASILLTSATGAVVSQGAAAATPAVFMTLLTEVTQDWAMFTTTFDPDNGSGNTQKLLFAQWNGTQNNRYAYIAWDTDASPTNTVPATGSLGYLIAQSSISGTYLQWEPTDLLHAAFAAGVGASIDFTRRNGRFTWAFRTQSGLTPAVTNGSIAANLIANGYNFYGSYATANQNFVQNYPGQVSGPFQWMDSYINEIWLNNNFQLAFMTLLGNAPSIPYNVYGDGLIEAAAADPINAGLNFGAVRAGVTLSAAQIAEVNGDAGKNIASTIQQVGYYFLLQDADPITREARDSPPLTFFYADGQSVQKINLDSVELQ